MENNVLIVGAVSDDPFAIDIAHHFGQKLEVSDVISLKSFANSEFCPRFICDEVDEDHIGNGLRGKTVIVVSTCIGRHTRNALAMRNFLIAQAARDNGAERVVLVETDLFFSAQDRGPREHHGDVAFKRDVKDYKKFNGQPFSSLLYAQLLKAAGFDSVITVHNHSISVQRLFSQAFNGNFFNLSPAELYADYLLRHAGGVLGKEEAPEFVICAPDKGAKPFVEQVYNVFKDAAANMLIKPKCHLMLMDKIREGERSVRMDAHKESPIKLEDLKGKHVVVFDDMIRTGNTIVECCKLLKSAGAERVIFVVTHFHSSEEVKENLNHPSIDEIITTNSLPDICNRDMQGRLRKKMLVLKMERWIANFLRETFLGKKPKNLNPLYSIDVSSKNPRWKEIERSRQNENKMP